MQINRKQTKTIQIGDITVGGDSPIAIQSMCNTKTEDVVKTIEQVLELEAAGCEIIRVAVPHMEAAKAISQIKKAIHIPLVADIHFDYRLALEAISRGVDKIRLNPGNIGSKEGVKAVVEACKSNQVPIRVGVNGGSLSKAMIAKYGGPRPEALFESAKEQIELIEAFDYDQMVVSIKTSDVMNTLKAYEMYSEHYKYPTHIGITEAGTVVSGSIKSAVGLGVLLSEGIGDTLRVSLTGNPIEEVKVAKEILKSLNIRSFGVKFISCPTCGRTQIDMIKLARLVEEKLQTVDEPITVAVMGCAVNGPGEAREADIGVAGGVGEGLIFKKGEIIRKVPEDQLMDALMHEVDQLLQDKNKQDR